MDSRPFLLRDDATAALLGDGCVVGISEEERFVRVKHAVERPRGPFASSLGEADALDDFELRYFPEQSINYLLYEAGIDHRDIDVIACDFDFDRRIKHWDKFLPVSELSSVRQAEEFVAMLRYWQRWLRNFAERIANDPLHAIANFYTTAMDALVMEDFVLVKQHSARLPPGHGMAEVSVQP